MSKPASALKKRLYLLSTKLLRYYYRTFWKMNIGAGVRIARSARLDTTNPRGIHIGDYTALSFDVAILSHDFINAKHVSTRIGSHCLIGARSIVLPGVTIGDHCVIGAGSVVIADVPDGSLMSGNPARVVERGIRTGKWGIRSPRFLTQPGSGAAPPAPAPAKATSATAPVTKATASIDGLLALDPSQRRLPLTDSGFDSFSLVTIRAEIETLAGTSIDDDSWGAIETPDDLLRLLPADLPGNSTPVVVAASILQPAATPAILGPRSMRRQEIGMPQMIGAGVSEGWLLKELGDMHWGILTRSLGVASSAISDARGERLYATFTAIRLRLGQSLNDIAENDTLELDMSMSRFGAGMFFSTTSIATIKARGEVEIMSNFSKFESPGQNNSLVRGQPHIPEDFVVPLLAKAPEIVETYRNARIAGAPEAVIFETDYELQPYHDINGVGLLYFAAYPIINDICLRKYFGGEDWREWTTIDRDIFYFANSGASAGIRFRIHSVATVDNRRTIGSTLSRIDDGKLMAKFETVQRRSKS